MAVKVSGVTKYLKAIAAALTTFTGAVAVAQADQVITNVEWVTIAAATLGALGVVWGVPNKGA
jgi:Iap family predicted aminopeptidase